MFEKLLNSFAENSSKYALVFDKHRCDYKVLLEKSLSVAAFLKSKPLSTNQIIGIYTEQNTETYAAILGIWFAGCAYLPLNPTLPAKRIETIINESSCNFIINCTDTVFPIASEKTKVFDYKSIFTFKSLPINEIAARSADSLMYVLFTSGSTGVPKGVMINYANLNAFCENILSENYPFNNNSRFLQSFDFSFDVSVASFLIPFLYGASVFPVKQDAYKFLNIVKKLAADAITTAFLVPSVVSLFEKLLKPNLFPQLQHTFFTGEALPIKVVEVWQQVAPNSIIENYYGPTEGTIEYFHYNIPRQNIKQHQGLVFIGKPLKSEHFVIVNEAGQQCKPNEKGELLISGKQICPGYINAAAKNKTSFVQKEFGGIVRQYYRTGDLCFYDEEGDVCYCSRLDEQVQVQGYRVELSEIESVALEQPYIKSAAAVAVSKDGLTKIYLFVVFSESINKSTLLNAIQDKLPAYMLPNEIITIENMPITSSGKKDKQELLKMIG